MKKLLPMKRLANSKLFRVLFAFLAATCTFTVWTTPASAADQVIEFTDIGKCFDTFILGNGDPSEVPCPTDNSALKTETSQIVNSGGVCVIYDPAFPVTYQVPCSPGGQTDQPPTSTPETSPPLTLPPCDFIKNGIRTCAVRQLGNGLEYFALVTCVAGIFVSAALWAMGAKGANEGAELTGKRGIVVCIFAAMVIGAYPALTSWYNTQAKTADNTGVTTATLPANGTGGS